MSTLAAAGRKALRRRTTPRGARCRAARVATESARIRGEATDSETYGSFGGGVVLGGDVVYFGPSVSMTTQEGADPTFGVTLGFVI